MMKIAVLFARADSVYKTFPDCDVWDADRDARLWPGGSPLVAHPPCRAWGRLRSFAKPRPDEMDLARFAVAAVRLHGGVLEHPEASTLWGDQGLPLPGAAADQWGGWTFAAPQFWWGHKAEKSTWLYICGIEKRALPPVPFCMGEPEYVVSWSRKSRCRRKHLSKSAREHTPPNFARWLVDLAGRCQVKNQK
jgi:hypothetical protein